jgi:hypothetical protein
LTFSCWCSSKGSSQKKDDGELDFTVVKKRLLDDPDGYVASAFATDVRRIFQVAIAKNSDSSDISQKASALSKIFEGEWGAENAPLRKSVEAVGKKEWSEREKQQLVERLISLPPKALVEGIAFRSFFLLCTSLLTS